MHLLYSLVLSLLFLILLPYFAYQAVRRGKYSGSFKERLGFLPESLRDDRSTIWVHAVSVGEFLASKPLLLRLKQDYPAARIVVSTTTLTGQNLARTQSQLSDASLYFPFDWKFAVRRSLEIVNPSLVIVLETELWPNFLRECRRRGVVIVLANGRISERSFRRYKLLGQSFKRVVEDFSLMVMQSEEDVERACELGASRELVRTCGNLKYDVPDVAAGAAFSQVRDDVSMSAQDSKASDQSSVRFDLKQLIVAGSTAPGEDEMLLASLRGIRRKPGLEGVRMLLAPRHPERFDEVARLLERSGFSFCRRSELPEAAPSEASGGGGSALFRRGEAPDVILLDTIGELAKLYRYAAVVFVGGSLVRRGGHNIIEPAAFARPIIVGPHTENFKQIVSDFLKAGAVIQIDGEGSEVVNGLTRELARLLSNNEEARAIGDRAKEFLTRNRGATDCTIAMIKEAMRAERF